MANGLGFRVTDTREISMLTNGGGTVSVYRVWIQTDRGATGSVDVPKTDWEAEKLATILATKAQELDLAFALTGA